MSDDNKAVILLVDDEPNNLLLLKQVLKDKYNLRIAYNGKEAIKRAQIHPLPDLILLDVMMPEMDGYETIKKLKSSPLTSNIPVIFLTAKSTTEDQIYGFELGAVDYITKPISPPIVKARVKNHLSLYNRERHFRNIVKKQNMEILGNQERSIVMLGAASHYKDDATGEHIWRMARYTEVIAEALHWDSEVLYTLKLAAALHDTGKIGIPDKILKAERSLTNEEWEIMKTHSTIGFDILSKHSTVIFKTAAIIALYHHEKWDGSGYPNGLQQEDIPIEARIVAIADTYDALTMVRPYKKAWSSEDAINEMIKLRGTHFDPNLLDIFINNIDRIEEIKESTFD